MLCTDAMDNTYFSSYNYVFVYNVASVNVQSVFVIKK